MYTGNGKRFVTDFIFQCTQYAYATEKFAGIKARLQFHAGTDLFVELLEFKILVPVDDIFGFVAEVVDA